MGSFYTPEMKSMQNRLMNIGKNFVQINDQGQAVATTGGKIGRFFGRIAAFFSDATRIANQRTVEALVGKINSHALFGERYAAMFRNQAAAVLADGKPLSGRTISVMLGAVMFEAEKAYTINAERNARCDDLVALFVSPDQPLRSFPLSVEKYERALGMKPGSSGVVATGKNNVFYNEMYKQLREVIEKPDLDDIARIGDAIAKKAVLSANLLGRQSELMKAMGEKYGLADGSVDAVKFQKDVIDVTVRAMLRPGAGELTEEALARKLNKEMESFAKERRKEQYNAHASKLFATDDSAGGFVSAFTKKVKERYPDTPVAVTETMWKSVADGFKYDLRAEVVAMNTPVDAKELATMRDKRIDDYLAGINQWAEKIPADGGERKIFLETAISVQPWIKPEHRDLTYNLSKTISEELTAGLASGNQEGLRNALKKIDASINEQIKALPVEVREKLDSRDSSAITVFALALGLGRMAGKQGDFASLGQQLTRTGAPFVDLMYVTQQLDSSDDSDLAEINLVFWMCNLLVDKVLPAQAERLSRVGSLNLSETSLAFQRQLLGPDIYADQGLTDDFGIAKEMANITEQFKRDAQADITAAFENLKNKPKEPENPVKYASEITKDINATWPLVKGFCGEFNRTRLTVNGKFFPPPPGQQNYRLNQEFIDCFPNLTVASQLAPLITQRQFHTLLELFQKKGDARVGQNVFNNFRFLIPPASESMDKNRSTTIDTINEAEGTYRVTFEILFESVWPIDESNPLHSSMIGDLKKADGSVSSCRWKYVLEVKTGEKPEITKAETDIIFSGMDKK